MNDGILMSDQTRALYNPEFIEFLEGISHAPQIIFSVDDFQSGSDAEALADHQNNVAMFTALGVTNPQLQNSFIALFEIELTQGEVGAHALNLEYSELENMTPEQLESFASKLEQSDDPEKAMQDSLSFAFQDRVISVISAPKLEDFKAFTSYASGIEIDNLILPEISMEDYQALIALHETEHLNQNPEVMSHAEREWRADIAAYKSYNYALEIGAVSDVNIPSLTAQLRAISVLNNYHEGSLSSHGFTAVSNAYIDDENPDFEKMSGDFTKGFTQIITNISEPFMDGMDEQEMFDEGLRLSQDQPELLYASAKELLLSGALEDNLAAKTLAENFVIGAEKLAPNHFKVEGPLYSELSTEQSQPSYSDPAHNAAHTLNLQ